MTEPKTREVSNLRDIRALEATATALRGIDLDDEALTAVARSLHLVRLDLSGCDALTDSSVSLLRSMTSLEDLDLSLCNQITDLSLDHLSRLPSLRRLNLNWCYSISDIGLGHLGACQSLQSISLWSCERITDDGITALAALPNLKNLELPEFANITDRGIRAIALSKSPVESLRLDHLTKITESGTLAITNLKHLRRLSITHCPQISHETATKLTDALPGVQIDFQP